MTNVPGPSAHRRGVFVAAAIALLALWGGGVSWFLLTSIDPQVRWTQVQSFVDGNPGNAPAMTGEQAFLHDVKAARLGLRTADAEYVAFPDQELLKAGRDTCDLLDVGYPVPESAAQRALVLHLRKDGDGWPPSTTGRSAGRRSRICARSSPADQRGGRHMHHSVGPPSAIVISPVTSNPNRR